MLHKTYLSILTESKVLNNTIYQCCKDKSKAKQIMQDKSIISSIIDFCDSCNSWLDAIQMFTENGIQVPPSFNLVSESQLTKTIKLLKSNKCDIDTFCKVCQLIMYANRLIRNTTHFSCPDKPNGDTFSCYFDATTESVMDALRFYDAIHAMKNTVFKTLDLNGCNNPKFYLHDFLPLGWDNLIIRNMPLDWGDIDYEFNGRMLAKGGFSSITLYVEDDKLIDNFIKLFSKYPNDIKKYSIIGRKSDELENTLKLKKSLKKSTK